MGGQRPGGQRRLGVCGISEVRIPISAIGRPGAGKLSNLSLAHYRYFLKFEKFVPHKLFPRVNASLHGASGPVEGAQSNGQAIKPTV